jgi:plastocyanin domain-containing protein
MISGIASLGLIFGSPSPGIAQMPHETETMQPAQSTQVRQFDRIEQPFVNKAIVTLGGFGLIGLELWWFLLSKPKSRKATTQSRIQNVTK